MTSTGKLKTTKELWDEFRTRVHHNPYITSEVFPFSSSGILSGEDFLLHSSISLFKQVDMLLTERAKGLTDRSGSVTDRTEEAKEKDVLIVALDLPTFEEARNMIIGLGGQCNFYKVGMQAYFAYGEAIIRYLKTNGKKVMLDMKLNDIPSAIEKAFISIGPLKVDYLTLFCRPEAIELLDNIKIHVGTSDTKLIIITHLTPDRKTTNDNDLMCQRISDTWEAGANGYVCSVEDVYLVQKHAMPKDPFCTDKPIIICPGTRMPDREKQDQVCVGTPRQAINNGATHIVVGRAITTSDFPAAAATEIIKSMTEED